MKKSTDKELCLLVKEGDEKAFETLFHRYYSSLCLLARQYVDDDEKAEEVVQDIFVKIWSKRKELLIETSFKQYLLRSVKNQCINQLNKTLIQNMLRIKDRNPVNRKIRPNNTNRRIFRWSPINPSSMDN